MSRIVPRIVFSSRGEVELDEIVIDDPAPNQILVGVRKTQVSAGSERNSLENEHGEDRYRYPRPTGYTSVGVVEAIGADVKGYVEGDRVLILSPHQGAALVEVDPRGHPDQSYAGKVPDDVTDSQATFAILGDVALHGVRRARPYLGESVAVFAQGLVGQLTPTFASLAGAYPVIAVDILDERLERSRESGATHIVNASEDDAVAAVHDLTGGGARVVFMAARDPRVLPDCLKAAARGATVCLTGSPPGTVELNLQHELLRHELDLIGNYQSDYPAQPYHRFQWTRPANRAYILDQIRLGRLKVDHLISHDVSYTRASEMYQMISEGPKGWLGVIFDWT